MADDLFVGYNSADPHTSIPDWLCTAPIDPDARQAAHALLILSKRPYPPTRLDLAEYLGVDVRTIDTRLGKLRSAELLQVRKAGRQNLYQLVPPVVVRNRTADHMDQRSHAISDHMRSAITCDQVLPRSDEQSLRHHNGMNGANHEKQIADHPHGGGGGPLSTQGDPLPTTQPPARTKVLPAQITTETGRYMVREWGFSLVAAHELQGLDLDACKADYAHRRQLNQGNGAIINAWRVAPPAARQACAGPSAGPWTSEAIAAFQREFGPREDSCASASAPQHSDSTYQTHESRNGFESVA